ncbi:FUSC family protein [Salidesulfovibrio onnuriiensis]|uniref:FUSC family protein n=1 Tax=Salidesulfovibrio onnuriiensis TaxID=2583823 RepID=UPI0011C86EBD|nr:FUSC family protein [Salidesulfovibrio onnuriiensis]
MSITPFIPPDSVRAHLVHALKTGLAAAIAFGVAEVFKLHFAYWASLSAVIVMQINVADSLQMCWYRFSGTAVGAVIGILVILIFPETTAMTYLGLFLSVAFCAYMTRYNNRYKMAAITVTIVVLASLGSPERVTYGLFRVLEIGIGVGSAFLVSLLLLPQRVGLALERRLTERFCQCAAHYNALMEGFLSLQEHLDPHMLDGFTANLRKDRELYNKVLKHERIIYHDDTALMGLKLTTLEKCTAHAQAMLDALNSHVGHGYEILMAKELRRLTEATTMVMRQACQGELPHSAGLAEIIELCEDRLAELRAEGVTKRFYLQKLTQFFAFYHGAHFMARDMVQYATDPMLLKMAGRRPSREKA